ncbi:MAG: hypothetical protein J5958_02435 [Clostridia bacterium]|nr:hypothetical protein [Clostridia bacterium]
MGRLKETAKGLLRRAGGRGGIGAATVVLIIALVVILNVIFTALATRYSWYLYTAPRYEHEIGDSSETLFSDLDQGRDLKIRFCMNREKMEGDSAYRLVLETARQFAEKYDFISVDFLNIVVMPGDDAADIERYKYGAAPTFDPETGKKVKKNNVVEMSVIFDAGGNDFSVTTLQSFFILDSQQYVTGYDGERVMSALIHRTMADGHPIACFTVGHGETSSELLYNILVCAGYEIRSVDLAKEEIPDGTTLVVVSNPLYDFETAAAGSGLVSETDRLAAFAAGEKNTVFVILDPLITELPHLNAYLSDWGLSRREGTVRDMTNSLTSDGYAVSTSFSASLPGEAIRDRIRAFSDADVVLKRAAAIDVTSREGTTAYPVLSVGRTASIWADGKKTDGAGEYAVAAYASRENGAGVFLVSSVYMTSSDAIRTNGYANADFIYAVLEYANGAAVPLGTKVMLIETDTLEGATRGMIRLTLAILFAVIPAAVVTVGCVVRVKRKNR